MKDSAILENNILQTIASATGTLSAIIFVLPGLVIVGAGAAVIPFVLKLLTKAYGFAGAANVGVVAPNPLPASQATLISALAPGRNRRNLAWKMLGIGELVGVALILLDTTLAAMNKMRIPPLAVGIGISRCRRPSLWLSARCSLIGATNARAAANSERADRLVASGLIVGERLWGVLNAGLSVSLSNDAPLALAPEDFLLAPWLSVLGFVAAIVLLYGWMLRRSAAVR